MVGGVGAAGDFVEGFAFWQFDFVGVEVVFCFHVAEEDRLRKLMGFSIAINFVERFVEYF